MKIDCISDLHGFYPKLDGGDLLIIAGDLTARDRGKEYEDFNTWLLGQDYNEKIVIAGNHDNFLIQKHIAELVCMGAEYLCDSVTEFQGLKIWGVPYSLWFPQINAKCAAFTGDEEFLKSKYDLIPNDIDILVSHAPAYGVLDQNFQGEHCGSKSLLEAIERIKPRLVVHGHIHEKGSIYNVINGTTFVNASYVNEIYQPVNKPVRIEI